MYHGNKRLPYTKIYTSRQPQLRDRWSQTPSKRNWVGSCPEEVVAAIVEWIDEELSPTIKSGINFRKQTDTYIRLTPNREITSTALHGGIEFLSDRVKIAAGRNMWGLDWAVEIPYSDPGMFDAILTALRRIYNGAIQRSKR